MRLWLTAFLVLTGGFARGQQEICVSCELPIQTKIYMAGSPYHRERKPVCAECAKDPNYCFTCRLPAKKNLDLKDGRVLCKRDAKTAVLSGDTAKVLFEEVKRDMIILLRGSKAFPRNNITFSLVDRHELESLSRLRRFPSTHSSLMGITRSREKDDKWEHEISVLAGMPPNKFLGVCAHEYGHAWLHENLTKYRELDSDTVEGFCEFLAYKWITAKGDKVEQKLLLENDYTRGQIDAFVKAESEYNFHLLTKWVMAGQDVSLSITNLRRVLVLKSDPDADTAAFAWPPPTAAQIIAPTNLMLKSISGPANRRFAMINGATLAVNELAKIPLASGKVAVRCLEIRDASVLIQVTGESAPQELFLPVKIDAAARQ
jgi:hypothetical protein